MGEVASGNLKSRTAINEVLALVERRRLLGTGIGWVDAHLLASSLLVGAQLWTFDQPLAREARRLGVAASS